MFLVILALLLSVSNAAGVGRITSVSPINITQLIHDQYLTYDPTYLEWSVRALASGNYVCTTVYHAMKVLSMTLLNWKQMLTYSSLYHWHNLMIIITMCIHPFPLLCLQRPCSTNLARA